MTLILLKKQQKTKKGYHLGNPSYYLFRNLLIVSVHSIEIYDILTICKDTFELIFSTDN